MHVTPRSRQALCAALLALAFVGSAAAFPAGQDLYVQPASQPFIENAGETIVTVTVNSGSLADAQSQLDAARAANPDAVIVLALSGTYTVTAAPLTLPSHTCLVLSAGTVVQADPTITASALIAVTSQTNVSISGGTLDGNGQAVAGIRVTTCDRVHIDKVFVQNCGQDGIALTGHGNSTFDNEQTVSRCEVTNCGGNGISFSSGTQNVGIDNYCHNNSGSGIYLAAARSTVANNRCIANSVGITAHGNDSAVTDNTIDSNATGILLDASSNNNLCTSNVVSHSTVAGIADAGTSDTVFQNVFSGNAANFSGTGTGANVIAWRGPLAASGQNYFYPPLVDDQHALTTIMNGKGRTDLTIGSATIDSVQTQYNAAVAANPNNVIVLHLTGTTYTVGANPLTLSSNTCVLLDGTIQISSSTSASTAIRADGQSYICISGGKIDGGGRTGKNAVYITNGKMIWLDKITLGNLGPSNPRVGGSDVVHFSGGSTPYIVSRSVVNGGAARGIWAQLSGQKAIYTDNECMNVNQDGIDCDSSTYSSLCKFNYCHDNVRYGIFFEQRAPYNVAIGNTIMRNGRGMNVYNNGVAPDTRYNTVVCNLCDSNSNAIRNGSTGTATDGTISATSHNFFFNNRAINSSGIGIESDPVGTQNYYAQNISTGNGTNIRTSGVETFFNPMLANATAANPVFNPPAGSYVGPQSITITSATNGASIRYTTDGSTPSETNGTLYAAPIALSGPATIRAIAYAATYGDSAVTTAAYTIQVAPPVFSQPSGIYSGAQSITLTSATPGAAIRYTTDGSTPTSTTGTLYAGPITVAVNTTINAIAYAAGAPDSSVATVTYTISSDPPVSAPVFSPTAGTYTTIQSVTMTSATSGASIRYTTDGSAPSQTNGTLYSGAISIAATTTLKAIAYAPNRADSSITSGLYTINLPTAAAPTFSPAGGTFTSAQSVTMATTTSGASIRYTTDGSTPTATTGTLYTTAISLNATTTLKAVAFKTGFNPSSLTSATYTINIKVAAPVISPNGGAYSDPQTVTLSSATSGASIRYTTDGSTPTSTTGTLYSAPITLSSTATLNAIAFKSGLTNSDVSSSYFAIGFSYEAEFLQYAASSDGSASLSTETGASGGAWASNYQYVTLGAPGVGTYIEFTLQDIPAGTYSLVMRYKSHPTNRGILQLSVDGEDLGTPLDEYASKATFSSRTFGFVHFSNFGDHTVRLTVIGKNPLCTLYNVTADRFDLVPDKTAPVITVPAAITAEATGPSGAPVTFAPTATDNADGTVPVTCVPASGSTFPLGTTTVTATATDFAGNTATKTFTVTVRDTTPPVLTLPGNITAEATGPAGAAVTFAATASDLVSGDVPVTLSPASGSTFALGTTTVTATATDGAGNSVQGTFTVTIVDTTPPALTLPSDIVLEATSSAGASAVYSGSAVDLVSGDVPVHFSIPSGSTFPLGTTLVTATATDLAGNSATGTFTVTVRDTTAPTIDKLSVSKSQLWPALHQMVSITVRAHATDIVDPSPTLKIISVSSNEPVNGPGDGDTSPDWEITGDLTLDLRAERAGTGSHRVYTITVEARDAAGNASTSTVQVTVPHDMGHND